MAILHLDTSPDSAQRLADLFSTYGNNLSLAFSAEHIAFLLSLLEEGLITVTKFPYEYLPDIGHTDQETGEIYSAVSRGTRWHSGTFIERARVNALYQLKKHGTPIVSDGKYFLYEDSHICALAGNEEILNLISYLSLHPGIEKWILFTRPTPNGAAYYVFDLTPQAAQRIAAYYNACLRNVQERMSASHRS